MGYGCISNAGIIIIIIIIIKSRQQRSLIAQLRLGILPIYIETGRFRGTQLDERICQLSDTQEVEDEIHFVCKCNLYNDLRKTIYRTVEHKHNDFYMYGNKDKYIFLVQNEWKILGNYLVEAWSESTFMSRIRVIPFTVYIRLIPAD